MISRCASGRSTARAPTIVTLPAPLNAVAVAPTARSSRRRERRGVFPRRRRAGEGRRAGLADAGDRARGFARRRVGRGGRHPRLGRGDRAQGAQARAHVGRAGLPVWSVAFLPDNRTLLTGGTDRIIRRWDAVTGDHIGAVAMGAAETRSPPSRATRARKFSAPASPATRSRPTRATAPARRLAGIFGRGSQPCRAIIPRGAEESSTSCGRPNGREAVRPRSRRLHAGTKMPEQRHRRAEDRKAFTEFLERATSK